jgi:hypothetical protein
MYFCIFLCVLLLYKDEMGRSAVEAMQMVLFEINSFQELILNGNRAQDLKAQSRYM